MNDIIPKANYSEIAPTYDGARKLPDSTMDQWVGLIRDRGSLQTGSLCLDLGCGTGRFTIPTAESTGAQMVGADLSAEMLSEAVSKPSSGKVWWVRCDAQELAFRDKIFDCVFMSLILHHVPDIDRVLNECYRVLVPGGTVLIRTTAHEDMATMPVYKFFQRAYEIDCNRLPQISVLEDKLVHAGFNMVGHEKVVQYLCSSVDAYLYKMHKKSISSLTLLTEEEFSKGFEQTKSYLTSLDEQTALNMVSQERMTLVIGRKK